MKLSKIYWQPIVADESVDFRIVQRLRQQGYSVYSILTEIPEITDTKVIAAEKNGYILTEDKDFGDELVYRKTEQIGSMLLRLSDLPPEAGITLVLQTITVHSEELKGCFSVLTSKKLRIRKHI